ncbi:MAG: ABC transporter ATP-binding protein [Oscillospiraceae bacterium]|nr:ABC transporter ATP-binding protein [Oscillospiraceae bacterium]
MKQFWACTRGHRKDFFLAVLFIEAETGFELIIPMIMASMIDVGVAQGDRRYILLKGLEMVGFALLALFLGHLCAKYTALCGSGIAAQIRETEYRQIQTFSFVNTDHFNSASLVTRLTGDVTTIQNALTNGMRPGFRSPVMLLMAVIVSFLINPRLALVFYVAAPILGLLLYVIIRQVRPLYVDLQRAWDRMNRLIQENLTGIRVVKAYVREEHETEKFDAGNQELGATARQAFTLATLNMPAFQLVMYGTILAILWFGGRMVTIGGLKVGELTSFLSYVLQVLNSLMMFSNVFLLFTRSLTSWRRIEAVLQETPTITDAEAVPDARITRGSISFARVSFKYEPAAPRYILEDISFTISAGQLVGIIGQTGTAKSTLVQLIPRLYEADAGTIRLDGRPVQQYTQAHLREQIGLVLQNNVLFSGTVRENLLWGNPNADEAWLRQACHIACVDEFIDRLDAGLDTVLGQGGVNLSGGQKQRLCLARCIIQKPLIFIFDDATSAVDTATEVLIRQRLREAFPHTTTIMISQRISSVEQADQVLVLDGGRLNGCGRPAELLQHNQIYRELWQLQQAGKVAEA